MHKSCDYLIKNAKQRAKQNMVAGWEELRKGNLIYTLNLIAYSDKWLSVGCCPRFLFCVSNEMREHQRRQKKKKRNNKEGNSRDYSRAASNQQRYITFGIMNCYFAVKKKKRRKIIIILNFGTWRSSKSITVKLLGLGWSLGHLILLFHARNFYMFSSVFFFAIAVACFYCPISVFL